LDYYKSLTLITLSKGLRTLAVTRIFLVEFREKTYPQP